MISSTQKIVMPYGVQLNTAPPLLFVAPLGTLYQKQVFGYSSHPLDISQRSPIRGTASFFQGRIAQIYNKYQSNYISLYKLVNYSHIIAKLVYLLLLIARLTRGEYVDRAKVEKQITWLRSLVITLTPRALNT
jgi:hypothetical protein